MNDVVQCNFKAKSLCSCNCKLLIKQEILFGRKTCFDPFRVTVPCYIKFRFFLGQVVEHLYGRQVSVIGA
jgi:hypothetical protein